MPPAPQLPLVAHLQKGCGAILHIGFKMLTNLSVDTLAESILPELHRQ
jgi:hypothetical protein